MTVPAFQEPPAPSEPAVKAPDAPADAPAAPETGPNGYPLNTKPDAMSPEHQAAYWRHTARQAQDHNKANAARIKELEPLAETVRQLEEVSQTEAEKAIRKAMSDGEKAGRDAALAEAKKTYGSQLVGVQLDAAAEKKGMTPEQIRKAAGGLERFLGDDGVDDGAVADFLAAIPDKAAVDVRPPGSRDLGGGRRDSAKVTGTQAGAALWEQRHPKKTTSA